MKGPGPVYHLDAKTFYAPIGRQFCSLPACLLKRRTGVSCFGFRQQAAMLPQEWKASLRRNG